MLNMLKITFVISLKMQDAQQFYNEIPLKLGIHKVQEDGFNHFDFLWGIDAPRLVYPKILRIIEEISNRVS